MILLKLFQPIFTSLYGYWKKFQDQVAILTGIKEIFVEMYSLAQTMEFDENNFEDLRFELSDSPKFEKSHCMTVCNSEVKVFNKRNLSMIRSAKFEVNEFFLKQYHLLTV